MNRKKDSTINQIQELDYHIVGPDVRNKLPHQDNCIEILQFWSSGGNFIVRNSLFPIFPGALLIVNATEVHYSNPDSLSRYTRNKIIVPAEFFRMICDLCHMNEFANQIFKGSGSIFCPYAASSPYAQAVDRSFHSAYEAYTADSKTAIASVVESIIEILIVLLENPTEFVRTHTQDPAIKTSVLMSDYINSKMQNWQDFSLSSLSRDLHISESHAAHLFKKLTGKSMTTYTMELRIAEAKKYLLSTEMRINEIAELLNFKDSTTFCKTFNKYVGQTPKTYRNSGGTRSSTSTGRSAPKC